MTMNDHPQDEVSLHSERMQEALAVIGNCNIKIVMKVEDPEPTFDLFPRTAEDQESPKP